MELFEHYGVFTHREMHSRYEIGLEQYTRSIGVEARSTYEIATTSILPAATRYQTEVATNMAALKGAGVEVDTAPLSEITTPLTALRSGLATLKGALAGWTGDAEAEAKYAADVLIPAMNAVRTAVDALEGIVADDLWPLPTYQEMMYIL
jgi:glutamine synthetase